MSSRGGVPNAWDDDDWEKAADVRALRTAEEQ